MPSRRTIAVAALICGLTVGATAYAESDWLKGTTEQKLKTLADVQPGLGTVMMEYSYRFSNAYYAAKAGNWPLAAYQLKEMREIQEVGETTRPEKADALKAFERSFLDPLGKTIEAKDFERFEASFKASIHGCDACHAQQKVPFIKYQLPSSQPAPLIMKP
ncbi:MAG: hypothetical protein WBW73_11340 [Rhodoplanes sp.]